MNLYYYFSESSPSPHNLAAKLGFKPTMWFSNHGVSATRPEFDWLDRDTGDINVTVLYDTVDERIAVSGHRGHPHTYDGIIVPNGEWLTDMFHPSAQPDYTPQGALAQYQLLYDLLDSRYPYANIGTWGVPTSINEWRTPHYLNGIQLVGRVSEIYDLMVPSGYFRGKEGDLNVIAERLDWADTFGKPILVGTNPWKRGPLTNDLWTPLTESELRYVARQAATLGNLHGCEVWSMVRKRDINRMRMAPEITDPQQIDDQHELALRIMQEMVGGLDS